jgi:hypothetical protein
MSRARAPLRFESGEEALLGRADVEANFQEGAADAAWFPGHQSVDCRDGAPKPSSILFRTARCSGCLATDGADRLMKTPGTALYLNGREYRDDPDQINEQTSQRNHLFERQSQCAWKTGPPSGSGVTSVMEPPAPARSSRALPSGVRVGGS